MEHIETTFTDYVTGSECLNYIDRDIGILSRVDWQGTPTGHFLPYNNNCYTMSLYATRGFSSESVGVSAVYFDYSADITKIANNKNHRLIGLILDEWGDGSFRVAILGNDNFGNANKQYTNYRFIFHVTANPCHRVEGTDLFKGDAQAIPVYSNQAQDNVPTYYIEEFNANSDSSHVVDLENIFDYTPTLRNMSNGRRGALYGTGSYGTNRPFIKGGAINYTVTPDKNNTLIIGNTFKDTNDNNREFIAIDYLRQSPYNMLGGNLYDFALSLTGVAVGAVNSFPYIQGGYSTEIDPPYEPDIIQSYDETTLQTIPVNLILTRNESQALSYLQNGALPSDAFMFPLDWSNIPQNMPSDPTDDEGGDDPTNNEDLPTGIEGDPTVDADPEITPSVANNNNVYWLQAGQLQAFITWFWTQAGEIIELDDLWNRIIGLYNDLSSAVLMIRYFPVNVAYIGGTEDVNDIIVGMVTCNQQGVKKLLKRKPTKVTLGNYTIPTKYNSFADFSPYTELMLYLPFHGWLSLDVDIFMGKALRVKGIYDYMSGTLQYLIYVVDNGERLVNSCIVKMAVDIPITLQSKTDRDSAIFNNVTSAMGNLLSAGMSIKTHSPIGLVMSTQNLGVNGSSSAPIKTFGTQGETGAYFAPNRLCVYLKRPSYNRPNLYKSRVGYPCNKGCYLGVGKDPTVDVAKGFTTVYNPTITFAGNTYSGKKLKPLQTEIEEIYSALEKGVII